MCDTTTYNPDCVLYCVLHCRLYGGLYSAPMWCSSAGFQCGASVLGSIASMRIPTAGFQCGPLVWSSAVGFQGAEPFGIPMRGSSVGFHEAPTLYCGALVHWDTEDSTVGSIVGQGFTVGSNA